MRVSEDGRAEGGVKLAPFSDLVPDDVREMVEEKKQKRSKLVSVVIAVALY